MENQNKIIETALLEMIKENGLKYQELKAYLEKELKEGKTEFRLKLNQDKSFYIHPLGKDGKTFDSK